MGKAFFNPTLKYVNSWVILCWILGVKAAKSILNKSSYTFSHYRQVLKSIKIIIAIIIWQNSKKQMDPICNNEAGLKVFFHLSPCINNDRWYWR